MGEYYHEYAELGINFGILSAHGIKGTNVATIAERHLLPLLPEEEQQRIKAAFVDQMKVAKVTEQMLTEDLSLWQKGVRRLYLIGDGVWENLEITDPQYVSFNLPV